MESDSRQTQGNASTKGLELRAVGGQRLPGERNKADELHQEKTRRFYLEWYKKCEMGGGNMVGEMISGRERQLSGNIGGPERWRGRENR